MLIMLHLLLSVLFRWMTSSPASPDKRCMSSCSFHSSESAPSISSRTGVSGDHGDFWLYSVSILVSCRTDDAGADVGGVGGSTTASSDGRVSDVGGWENDLNISARPGCFAGPSSDPFRSATVIVLGSFRDDRSLLRALNVLNRNLEHIYNNTWYLEYSHIRCYPHRLAYSYLLFQPRLPRVLDPNAPQLAAALALDSHFPAIIQQTDAAYNDATPVSITTKKYRIINHYSV